MSRVRRSCLNGYPVFITAVCYQRQPYLYRPEHKELLLSVMREVKSEFGFRMLGYVVLDDHFHWMIHPDKATTFPRIMQSIKLRFTRRLLGNMVLYHPASGSGAIGITSFVMNMI